MPADTVAALEWAEYEVGRCGSCGHHRAESFDVENDGNYDVTPIRCHACAARERAAESKAKDPNADLAGLFYSVTRRG